MAELGVLSVFTGSLILCIFLDISILAALVFGFFLFFGYGLYRKHSFRQMAQMALSGIKTVKNILITFVLIGIITAIWRVCGTIPYVVYHEPDFVNPALWCWLRFCCAV